MNSSGNIITRTWFILLALIMTLIVLWWWRSGDTYLTIPADQPNTVVEGSTIRPMTPAEVAQTTYLRWEFEYLTKVWVWLLQHQSRNFVPPALVFFSKDIAMVCGTPGSTARKTVTTFYCPENTTLYIDLSVDTLLQQTSEATARFARGYVLARAMGHHVQWREKTLERLAAQQKQLNRPRRKLLEERRQLQLDCYAGLWLHFRRQAEDIPKAWPIKSGIEHTWAIYEKIARLLPANTWQPEDLTHATDSLQYRWFSFGNEKGVEHACDPYSSLTPSL